MAKIPFQKARIKLVDQKEKAFNRRIVSFRKGLITHLISELSGMVDVDGKHIQDSARNIALSGRVDRIIENYIAGVEGSTFLRALGSDIHDVARLNRRYYASMIGDVGATWEKTSTYLNTYFGIAESGAVAEGSILTDAITSKQWVKQVKASVIHSVETGETLNQMKTGLERAGQKFDSQVKSTLPNVFDKAENIIGKQVSKEEQMHFAWYQGGKMKFTRPFCEERNNKLFHLSEIQLFGTPRDPLGGYTNKSQGEFQGKTDPYDPLVDLGGYNCRHRYFYISNELGFSLRPDLDPEDFLNFEI